jgi:hypothetical protein
MKNFRGSQTNKKNVATLSFYTQKNQKSEFLLQGGAKNWTEKSFGSPR